MRFHWHISSCSIRSLILMFQLTSLEVSPRESYPSKPALSLVVYGNNYARIILGTEMIYLTPKFSRVLSEIGLYLRIRGWLFKREEYRHFSTERFCFKVMLMSLRIYWRRFWNLKVIYSRPKVFKLWNDVLKTLDSWSKQYKFSVIFTFSEP